MFVKVRAVPAAKKESVEKKGETEFVIMVREPAERNLANKRIIELLAKQFRVSARHVRILTGHHSPTKMFSVEL